MPRFQCLRHLVVDQGDLGPVLKRLGSMALLETIQLCNCSSPALRCVHVNNSAPLQQKLLQLNCLCVQTYDLNSVSF